jgi:autotransporter-associated beta strand protein
MARLPLFAFFLSISLSIAPGEVGADDSAPHLWTGAGGNSNWSNPNNWKDQRVPSNDGTATVVVRDMPNANLVLDAPWSILRLEVSKVVTLNGSQLTIAGGVKTFSYDDSIVFDAPVALSNDQTWEGRGNFLTNGGLAMNGSDLTIRNALLQGNMTGSGQLKTSGEYAQLAGELQHTGGTVLNATRTTRLFGNALGAPGTSVTLNNTRLDLRDDNRDFKYIDNPIVVVGDNAFLQVGDRTYLHSLQGDSGSLRISVDTPQYEALHLVQPNGYTGRVTLDKGTLRGTSASLPTQIYTKSIDATLSFNQDVSGEYAGAISGIGRIEKQGIGALRLSGNNTFTESLYLEEGVVELDPTAAGWPSDATLVFSGNEDLAALQFVGGHTFTGKVGGGLDVRWDYEGGFSARDGKVTLNFFGDQRPITTAITDDMSFGSPSANDVTELTNPIDFGNASSSGPTMRIHVHQGTGGDRGVISGEIRGNGNLFKQGPGVLQLTADNSYTRETRIERGALMANDGEGLSRASQLTLAGPDAVLMGDGPTTFARNVDNAPGHVFWGGDGGFAASGGKMTVTLNNNGTLRWANGAFLRQQGTLVLGHTRADAEVELTNPLSLGYFKNKIYVPKGLGGDFARLSGNITGIGSFNKTGEGTLIVHSLNPGQGTFVDQGRLVNAGAIVGATSVASGASVSGAGHFAILQLAGGATIAPGTSIGIMSSNQATWASGGRFEFEIENAVGTPGIDWDLWRATGVRRTLTLGPFASAQDRLLISIVSSDDGLNGPAANFDPTKDYSWLFVSNLGSLVGFTPERFAIDLDNFHHDLQGGSFSVAAIGQDLYIQFTPAAIPEPSTLLLSLGAVLLCWCRRTTHSLAPTP